MGQENSTAHQLHDAKYAPTTSKAKTLLLMTVLFIIYREMKSNSLHFIVQFLRQRKCCFTADERRPYPPTLPKKKRAQHNEIIMLSSSFLAS